jgi:hypothetical protein
MTEAELTENRNRALDKANIARQEIKTLRTRITEGEVDLVDLLEDVPDCLESWTLIDVVRFATPARRRATRQMQRLGRLALRDGINLLMPAGEASLRSRRWVAVHVNWHRPGSNGTTVTVRP